MSYTIQGRVLDQTGRPIVGANVYLRLADRTIRDPYADRFDSPGFPSIQATPLIDQPLITSGVTPMGQAITTTQFNLDENTTTSTSGTQTLATTTTDNEGNFYLSGDLFTTSPFVTSRLPSIDGIGANPNFWFNLLYLEITDRDNRLIEIIRNPRVTNYEIIKNNTEIDVNFGGSINLTNYYPNGVYRVGSFLDRDILAISQEFDAISKFIMNHMDVIQTDSTITAEDKARLFSININVTVPVGGYIDNDLGYPTSNGGAGLSPTRGSTFTGPNWALSIGEDLISSLVFELDKFFHLNRKDKNIRYESTSFNGETYPKQVSRAFEQRIQGKPFQYLFNNRLIFNYNNIRNGFNDTPPGFESKESNIFNPVHPLVKEIIKNSLANGNLINLVTTPGPAFNVTIDVYTRNPRLICNRSKTGTTKYKNIITDNPNTFITFTRPGSLTNKPSANFLNVNPLLIPDRYRIITTSPTPPPGTGVTSTDFFNYTVDALGNTTRVDGSTPSPSPIVSNFSDDYYRNDDGRSGALLAWGFVAWLSIIMSDSFPSRDKDWLPRAQLFNQSPQYQTPSTILADGSWLRTIPFRNLTGAGTVGSRYPIAAATPPATLALLTGTSPSGPSVDPLRATITPGEEANGFYIPLQSARYLTTVLQAACSNNGRGSGPIYKRIQGRDEPIDHIREHIRRYVLWVADDPNNLQARPGLWIDPRQFRRQEIDGFTDGTGTFIPPLLKINDDTNYSWVARAVAYAGPISLNVVNQIVNVPLFYPQINSSGQVITTPSPPSVSKISIQSNTGAAYAYNNDSFATAPILTGDRRLPIMGVPLNLTTPIANLAGQIPSGYNIDFCDNPERSANSGVSQVITFEGGI